MAEALALSVDGILTALIEARPRQSLSTSSDLLSNER